MPYFLLGLFIFIFEFCIHLKIPHIGHDNSIWFDQLITGKWHFAQQGFFPFRFSPHLCAGAPTYGDPESLFYSLSQLLTIMGIQPWWAMQFSIMLAIVVGYYGWLQFSKKSLKLPESWAHVLSLTVIANGFYFMQLAVGHFQMHTMPFIGCFLALLFNNTVENQTTKDSTPILIFRSSVFALLMFYSLNGAGYNVLLFSAILIALYLPLDLYFSGAWKNRVRILLPRFALSGALTLGVLASKLVAVLSYMRYFSREEGFPKMWDSTNVFVFITKSLWSIFPTRDSIRGYGWDLQELSLPLSPLVAVGLMVGLYLLYEKRQWLRENKKYVAPLALYSLFVFVFLVELTQGHGVIANQFFKLPIVRSLRIASRFLYLLSLFATGVSVWCLARYTQRLSHEKQSHWRGMGFTLCFALFLNAQDAMDKLHLYENYENRAKLMDMLDEGINGQPPYQRQGVDRIIEGNTNYIQAGNICHIELLRKSLPLPVHVGPTSDITDGRFNLMNPVCYQYPTENHCNPGDRILESDRENFENFIRGKPTTWKLSTLQQISDYLSLITVITCLIALGIFRKKLPQL